MMISNHHQRLFSSVALLLMRQAIRCKRLFLHQITDVFFIFEDIHNVAAVPFWAAGVGAIPRCLKLLSNDGGTLLLHPIFMENKTHKLRTIRIDGHDAVLHVVAQQGCTEYNALFHLPGLSLLYKEGRPAAFFLCSGTQSRFWPKCSCCFHHVDSPFNLFCIYLHLRVLRL